MPAVKGMKKDADTIARLKEEYVRFFSDCPIQRRAAQSIGRDEDTIIIWMKDDKSFAEAVQNAEAQFVRKRLLKTSSDWQLERIFKSEFSQRQELTGANGDKLEGIIILKSGETPDEGQT